MAFFGTVLVLVGIVVIAAPELIAYFIGTLLVILGVNLLLLSYGLRRASKPSGSEKTFRFGDYEIVRNRR